MEKSIIYPNLNEEIIDKVLQEVFGNPKFVVYGNKKFHEEVDEQLNKRIREYQSTGLKEHLDKLKPIQPSKLTLSVFEEFINKLNNDNNRKNK